MYSPPLRVSLPLLQLDRVTVDPPVSRSIRPPAAVLIAIFVQVGESEHLRLLIVRPYKALAVTMQAAHAQPSIMRVVASPGLHAHAGLKARDHVGARNVHAWSGRCQLLTVGIASREIEEVDTREYDEEAGQERDGVDGVCRIKASVKGSRGDKGRGGESHVVKWVNAVQGAGLAKSFLPVAHQHHRTEDSQIRGEAGKSLVEVVHLRHNADNRQEHEDVSRRVRELVVTPKCQLHGDPEGLDRHDGHRANGRADGEIYECVLLAVFWSDLVYHHDGKDGHGNSVE